MLLIGWMMRAIILGAKFDECRACGVAGPHLILRKTHWFTVFRMPVVLLWISHGLLCPECGDYEGLGFLQVRKAVKSGRLPLGRKREGYENAVKELAGGTDPADWATIGLPPGSPPEVLKARWHDMAKTLHPDVGGTTEAFIRMQAVYRRLADAPEVSVGSVPDPADLFDPIMKNPKRGFFDFYLKAWPVIALIVVILSATQPQASTSGAPRGANPPPLTSIGTAHVCWESANSLVGCQDDTTAAMLFGTKGGRQVICTFVEPLRDGQYASCR